MRLAFEDDTQREKHRGTTVQNINTEKPLLVTLAVRLGIAQTPKQAERRIIFGCIGFTIIIIMGILLFNSTLFVSSKYKYDPFDPNNEPDVAADGSLQPAP